MTVHVFHHIPKCAGTSCKAAFRQWFNVIEDYRRDWSADAARAFLENRVDPARLDSESILTGHFEFPGGRLSERYPELLEHPDLRLISFVRDPLELAISMHHYAKSRRSDYRYGTLSERLKDRRNFLARMFGCDDSNFEDVLSRYAFVGIAEHLQQSMDHLARLLSKPRVEVAALNETQRDEWPSAEEISRFRNDNALDYAIYDFCYRRFAGCSRIIETG